MLQNLSKRVRDCLQHADECGQRAKHEPDPALARETIWSWSGAGLAWHAASLSRKVSNFSQRNIGSDEKMRPDLRFQSASEAVMLAASLEDSSSERGAGRRAMGRLSELSCR
jgi:hypothetical protein